MECASARRRTFSELPLTKGRAALLGAIPADHLLLLIPAEAITSVSIGMDRRCDDGHRHQFWVHVAPHSAQIHLAHGLDTRGVC